MATPFAKPGADADQKPQRKLEAVCRYALSEGRLAFAVYTHSMCVCVYIYIYIFAYIYIYIYVYYAEMQKYCRAQKIHKRT